MVEGVKDHSLVGRVRLGQVRSGQVRSYYVWMNLDRLEQFCPMIPGWKWMERVEIGQSKMCWQGVFPD